MNEIEQKEIEEMARIIAFELCPYGKLHAKLYENRARCASNDNFAECTKINKVVDKLYNVGYRNCKDKVVLSKEEYIENDRLMKLLEEKRLDELKSIHKIFDEVRQQTAREILKSFEYCNDQTFYEQWLKLAKEYGMEME